MAVTYKQVGEGCEYTIEPMYSGAGEIMTIESSKRREPVRSGLMLENDISYPIGTLVQLDIKFPGQVYTYRARGIVSWVDEKPSTGNIPIGITITGMDKLDQYGISVSISEPETPPPPSTPMAEPGYPSSIPPRVPLPPTEASWMLEEDSADLEYEDTAMNPIVSEYNMDDSTNWSDQEDAPITASPTLPEPPLSPLPVESIAPTRIQDFLISTDFAADTMPPSPDPSFSSDIPAKIKDAEFDTSIVRMVFQTLSLMMPQEGFGEKVYFEDVFVTAVDSPTPTLENLIMQPGKRSDFQIRMDGEYAGRVAVFLPAGDTRLPPSAYTLEQLLLMYIGLDVQVIRDRETIMDISEMACITRVASGTVSLRAVMAFDSSILSLLVRYKDGPIPIDENEDEIAFEDEAFDERPSRVSLVVADKNARHRVTVPLEARVSVVPAKIAGPISSQIDGLVAEAFESMENLYGAESHDEAANFALSLSRRLIKCEAAICALVAPEQNELYIAAIDGAIPETRLGARLSISDGLPGFCLRSGKVARSDHPQEIKASLLRETGLAVDNIMCAPISVGGKNIGAIELMNSTAESGFNRESADLLAYIANSLGAFISNSEMD